MGDVNWWVEAARIGGAGVFSLLVAGGTHVFTRSRDLAAWRREAAQRAEDVERDRRRNLHGDRAASYGGLLRAAWAAHDSATLFCRRLLIQRLEKRADLNPGEAGHRHLNPFAGDTLETFENAMGPVRLTAEPDTLEAAEKLRRHIQGWVTIVDEIDAHDPQIVLPRTPSVGGRLEAYQARGEGLIKAFQDAARRDLDAAPPPAT